MAVETPGQKYERLRKRVQQMMLTSYPNPDRKGCPDLDAVRAVAGRVGDHTNLDGDKDYDHVMHCSPCYRDFLGAREKIRESKQDPPPVRLSWRKERHLAKTLDQLDLVLKSLFRTN